MLLHLTSDQEFFRETTAKFLGKEAPVAELRRLRHDPAGFDPSYWRLGAELGWTSLLVAEEEGGGSISGDGLLDLSVVAHEFGRHAAPGPLSTTNVVAAAVSGAGAGAHGELLSGLLDGSVIASWCFAEPRPRVRPGDLAFTIAVVGDEVVLDGVKRPVESAGQSTHLLVTGRTGDGLSQVLVPAGAPGVSVEPLSTVDLTRRFSQVTMRDVRVPVSQVVGSVAEAGPQVEHQFQLAVVLATAESVGAMQAAFDMTVEWSFDRYSFGRPLASYQALKHRFADMKMWLEASHAASDAALVAVASGSPDAPDQVSAAKAFVGQYGSELVQDCVQIHGGIGVTFEHDLHLFVRRHSVNRTLWGTPAEHRRLLADLLERADLPEGAGAP